MSFSVPNSLLTECSAYSPDKNRRFFQNKAVALANKAEGLFYKATFLFYKAEGLFYKTTFLFCKRAPFL